MGAMAISDRTMDAWQHNDVWLHSKKNRARTNNAVANMPMNRGY